LQVFRDAGWDGKTPALPQQEHKKHHKHHKGSNAADTEAQQVAAPAATAELDESMEAFLEEDLLDEFEVHQEYEHEDDSELEDEVAGVQNPASTAADDAGYSAMPSLEIIKLARAAAVRQQVQLAGQVLGWSKPWWQQQRSMQLLRLWGVGKPEKAPTAL
jgi:hypothetical protein